VARGGVLNLAGAVVGGLATIALTLVVTRTFSQAAAGAFFTAMSLFLIVEAIASLGSATGTTYFIARLRALDQPRRIPEVLRAAVRPVAAVSVVAGLALVLLASPAAGFLTDSLGQAGARPAEVAAGLRALAVALPFAALLDTLLGATRGYRAMGPTNVVDRIGRPLLQLAGVAAAAAAGSAALLAPLWALAYLPAVVVVWFWLRRIRCRLILDIPAPPEPLRFWRFTGPRGLAALAQITIQRIDIVLVAVMRGPAQAAVYTAATRFLVAGQFGNQAISMAAQPRFTEMFTRGDHQVANRVYQATTAWLVVLTWPMYLLAVVFGPQVLAVFGRSYSAGGGHGNPGADHAAGHRVRAGRHGPGHHRTVELEPAQRPAGGGGQRGPGPDPDPQVRDRRRGGRVVGRDRADQPAAAGPDRRGRGTPSVRPRYGHRRGPVRLLLRPAAAGRPRPGRSRGRSRGPGRTGRDRLRRCRHGGRPVALPGRTQPQRHARRGPAGRAKTPPANPAIPGRTHRMNNQHGSLPCSKPSLSSCGPQASALSSC